jgi:hypothetical protein
VVVNLSKEGLQRYKVGFLNFTSASKKNSGDIHKVKNYNKEEGFINSIKSG